MFLPTRIYGLPRKPTVQSPMAAGSMTTMFCPPRSRSRRIYCPTHADLSLLADRRDAASLPTASFCWWNSELLQRFHRSSCCRWNSELLKRCCPWKRLWPNSAAVWKSHPPPPVKVESRREILLGCRSGGSHTPLDGGASGLPGGAIERARRGRRHYTRGCEGTAAGYGLGATCHQAHRPSSRPFDGGDGGGWVPPLAQPHQYKRKGKIFSHGCPNFQGWTVWKFSQGTETAISRFPQAYSALAQGNRATSDAGGMLALVVLTLPTGCPARRVITYGTPRKDWGPRAYPPARQHQWKRLDLSSTAKTSRPQAPSSSSWSFCCSSATVPSTRERCWTAKAYTTLSLQSPGSNIDCLTAEHASSSSTSILHLHVVIRIGHSEAWLFLSLLCWWHSTLLLIPTRWSDKLLALQPVWVTFIAGWSTITFRSTLLRQNCSWSQPTHHFTTTCCDQWSVKLHIATTARSCRFALYAIRMIRPFLSEQAAQLLVQALVLSRLDYCNSLLAGLPTCTIKPLQMIHNPAARVVFNEPKKAHVTPLFIKLHWLPIATCIKFKVLMCA